MKWNEFFEVYDELYRYVSSEAALADFGASVWDLREKARSVAEGTRRISTMPRNPVETFPDRAMALKVLEITGGVPEIDPDTQDEDTVRLAGYLLANLTNAILHAIMKTFPDL